MAKKKMGGLGKGLDSLFADLSDDTGSEASNSTLPLREIEPDPEQPRKRFDDDALNQLADSITENGLLQPIAVRPKKVGPGYIIIAGERRWRAARIAGLAEVPAIVIEADDRKMTELSLIENLQREDLDPIEEAEGYKTLMDNYHLTQEEAAERVGKSRSAVANSLRLLGLCPEVRQMLQNGGLSGGHARALLPLKADLQLDAANLIVKQGLSVRQTEALAKRLSNPKEERKPTNDELIAESYGRLAAQELSDKIGRTCRIVSGKKKGRIELDYYGIDDLNDLLEALAAIKRRKNGDE
jgi:ParB family chromosome partitioning protein